MAAFPLSDQISQTSSRKRTYRATVAEFGDGYTQRTRRGINAQRDTWAIIWENLSAQDAWAVQTALDTAGNWDTHTWMAFGDSITKKWRVTTESTLSSQGGDVFSVSTTIQQEFE